MVQKKPETPHHEEHADETWLIPYSDLLTLLLALFIVLFASSSLDKDKAAKIQNALAAAFSYLPFENADGNILNFMDDIKNEDLGDTVNISSDAKGAVMDISTINLFEPGSVTLKPQAQKTLKQIAKVLNNSKYSRYSLIVKGHTDDTLEASTNIFPSNWELSAARAGAVVRYLISCGLNETRFQAIGYAGIAPLAPNFDANGSPLPYNREKNRRVSIHIEF